MSKTRQQKHRELVYWETIVKHSYKKHNSLKMQPQRRNYLKRWRQVEKSENERIFLANRRWEKMFNDPA